MGLFGKLRQIATRDPGPGVESSAVVNVTADIDPIPDPGYYTGNKYPGGLAPALDILRLDYWQVRTQSERLFYSNTYARGIVRRFVTNVINTGLNLSSATDNAAGVLLPGNALVAGIKTVRLQSGKTVTIVTDTAGNVRAEENPSATGSGAGGARRTMWREIED